MFFALKTELNQLKTKVETWLVTIVKSPEDKLSTQTWKNYAKNT